MSSSEPADGRYAGYSNLRFERRPDGVLVITIDRPERLNAAHETLHAELAGVWNDVHADPATRVAVVTGAGRAFSAGGDLGMIQRMTGDYGRIVTMLRETQELVHNMVRCDKPIVSAINGVAVGAGLAVALLADISIAAEDAPLGDGHLRLGVAAGDHAAIIWPLLCGMAKAKYHLLTGDLLDGREAERIGLVSRAVPSGEVVETALAIASRLAAGPQDALVLTKRALNSWLRLAGPTFDASAAYEMLTFFGRDAVEGSTALLEKRTPRFEPGGD